MIVLKSPEEIELMAKAASVTAAMLEEIPNVLMPGMTTLELVLNMLAEATTTEISKQKAPSTFSENMAVAREGGEAAGIARKAVEERTGVPVITPKNAAQLNQVVTDLLEGAVSDTKEKPKDK